MTLPFRISTSPPSFSDREEDADASYYCDVYPFDAWKKLSVIQWLCEDYKNQIGDEPVAVYRVKGAEDKEFAILFCVEDDEDGLIYFAIDYAGRVEREPAANEALWHAANAAIRLPAGYRLSREAGPRSS